ncbi:hypothetical protein AB0L30_03785 [Microbispora rosea]|uniref:hypothetical protein n=1 Tax=Microbispora rosea TaxID=58117 RepID=UPI0034442783
MNVQKPPATLPPWVKAEVADACAPGRSCTHPLLRITEVRHYFPTSEIRFERLGGLVKSVIAVKRK